MPGSPGQDQPGQDRSGQDSPDRTDHDTIPPADTTLLAVAGVLLLIPIVALMWVSSYAGVEPKLGGFPFFIWYQFLWVFLCSACTYAAYRLVVKARPHRPMTSDAPKDQEAGR
jgi:membrane protein implicated in regulation of membrane protease activity